MAGQDYSGNTTEGKLSILDLSEAKIVEGGASYYKTKYTVIRDCYTANDVLGDYAFYNCGSLKTVYVNWETPINIDPNLFYRTDIKAGTLYVPDGTTDIYFLSTWGDLFGNIVEYSATGIKQNVISRDVKELSRYSVNGLRLDAPTKGLNIVKYSDGSVKKVVVR